MTFLSIIKKNFKYNFLRFVSFYFVNSLIVGMLFIYGTLRFNKSLKESSNYTVLSDNLNIALFSIVVFSLVFITYTNMEFLKSRGKEFGMYLTLGMTRKDLVKLVLVENIGILVASLVSGLTGGMLLGRMFYMGLSKLMKLDVLKFEVGASGIALSVGIFILIFIGNIIFNAIYISRVSILTSLKAPIKGSANGANIIVGFISTVAFIGALILLPQAILGKALTQYANSVGILTGIIIVAPFFMIATSMSAIKVSATKVPKFYNNNLILFGSLGHKLSKYKSVLYILALLTGAAFYFIGSTYSLYVTSEKYIKSQNPFDSMVVEQGDYNNIEKSEIEKLMNDSSVKIEEYKSFNFIPVVEMQKTEDGGYEYYSSDRQAISETEYNRHMGENIDVKAGSAINIKVYQEVIKENYEDIILVGNTEPSEHFEYPNTYTSEEVMEVGPSIVIDKENVIEKKGENFSNFLFNSAFFTGDAFVLDDADYKSLEAGVAAKKSTVHLMDVSDSEKAEVALTPYLFEKNNLTKEYWTNEDESQLEEEIAYGNSFKPFFTEALIKKDIEKNGMLVYVMMFIGVLFLLASGVVLYYKTLTQVSEDKERVEALRRIGMTDKEIKKVLTKELLIVFFVPLIIGGGIASYYISLMFSNQPLVANIINGCLIFISILGFILQVILLYVSRARFFRELLA